MSGEFRILRCKPSNQPDRERDMPRENAKREKNKFKIYDYSETIKLYIGNRLTTVLFYLLFSFNKN